LLNQRRLRAYLADRARPEYESKTVLELAFAAGFNSKAAFNAAFKKHTGLTPSQFRSGLPTPRPETR
jgi:AraC-like DNA-binding protein